MEDADNPIDSSDDANLRPVNWLQPFSDLTAPPAPPPADPAAPPRYSVRAIIALLFGLAGPLVACGLSLAVAALSRPSARGELPLMVGVFLAVGSFGLPLAWHAWQNIRGRPPFAWQTRWRWLPASGLLVVSMLVCGQLSVSLNWLPALVLALLQPLIFVAAGAAVLTLASGGWSGLSRFRAWGHLLSGAWLSILVSFAVEVLLVGAVGLAVLIAFAVSSPDQLREFVETYRSVEDVDLALVIGWLLQPWVIILALALASIAIPLIEELLKPIGVIALIGQRPAPMAAFLGGVMGGLGFAVTETLGNLVALADPWVVLILARMGTLVMHSFTSGLVGWGWGQMAAGRPRRLAGAYAGAVAIHGLWNALAVAAAYIGLYFQRTSQPGNLLLAGALGIVMMFCLLAFMALVVGCAAGLAWVGHRLRSPAQ